MTVVYLPVKKAHTQVNEIAFKEMPERTERAISDAHVSQQLIDKFLIEKALSRAKRRTW